MRDLARRLGRFGAWMALAETMFIVGFESRDLRTNELMEMILVTLFLLGCALLAGWGAARAPRRPIVAGILLWGAALLFGAVMLGYRNSSNAGPIHVILLVAPMAFLWGGLFAFIGKFTQAAPAPKA